jgi:hypothetical protein
MIVSGALGASATGCGPVTTGACGMMKGAPLTTGAGTSTTLGDALGTVTTGTGVTLG